MKWISHISYLLLIAFLLGALLLRKEPLALVKTPESSKETAVDWSKVYGTPYEDYYDRNLAFLGSLQSIESKVEEDPALDVILGQLEQAVKNQNWEMFADTALEGKLKKLYEEEVELSAKVITFLGIDIEGQMHDPPSDEEILNQFSDIWFVGFSPYSDTEIILFGYVKLNNGIVMKSRVIVDIAKKPYELSVFMG